MGLQSAHLNARNPPIVLNCHIAHAWITMFSPLFCRASASLQQPNECATHHDIQPATIYCSMQGDDMKTGLGIVHSNHLETLADALVRSEERRVGKECSISSEWYEWT